MIEAERRLRQAWAEFVCALVGHRWHLETWDTYGAPIEQCQRCDRIEVH